MATNQLMLSSLALAIVVGVAVYSQSRSVDQALGSNGRFTIVQGVYKCGGDDAELSTAIRSDTATGESWYLRVRKQNNGLVVDWEPIGVSHGSHR